MPKSLGRHISARPLSIISTIGPDMGLALYISPEGELEEVIAAWTSCLHHGAVAHCGSSVLMP